MNIRPSIFLIISALFSTAAVAHSGDEPPLYVAPEGVDAGLCQDADQPCRTIDYALGKSGKGAQIRVAAGHYKIGSDNELFHILQGTIDIRGSFDSEAKYQTADQETTILSGAPRDYAAQLRERGFFVAPDNKLSDRDSFSKVREQLQVHQALQLSMPATPCVAGNVNGMACVDVDLLSHVGLSDISARPSAGADVWGFVDLHTNREYAIVGFNTGTAVFDVTDAENPREVGFIDGQTASWRDIKVYQFWNALTNRWNAQAYITTDGSTDGLFVIDLSRLPHSIQRVNFTGDFAEAHNVYATNADYGTGLSLTGATPTLVIAGSERGVGQYRGYTVDNPAAPELVPGSGGTGYMHDAASMIITDSRKDTQCVNGTTYCEILFDFNENSVEIWDVTAANNPQRLSNTSYNNSGYVHSGWASEDKQHLFIHDEFDERSFGLNSTVNIFDLSDLTSPAALTPWSGPSRAIDHNGFARGNRYYMSNYSRGLTILDITDVASIQQVGHIDTFPATDTDAFVGAWGAYPFFHSGNIAISDIDSGFYMVADRTLDVAEGSLAFSSRSYGGAEGIQVQIPVERLGGSTGSVSVTYEVLGATATGDDIAGGNGVLNWANGDSADKMITLDLLGDGDTSEGLERLFVKLLAPTGGATLDYQNIASVYVAEAGAEATVEFADPEINTAERGFATAVVVVHRNGSTQGAVSVDYSITGGDATPGVDFQGAANGTINWADGDGDPKWIEYTIEDDGIVEPTESYELSLGNVNGATLGARGVVSVFVFDGEGANNAPNAVAGASQTVASEARVTLNGSGSNDPDGDALTYQWTQIAGDAVTIENATSASAAFTAPTVDSDQLLRFQLTVSDGRLQSSATASVTVRRDGAGFGEKSGGGAFGWLMLVVLSLYSLRRGRSWSSQSA